MAGARMQTGHGTPVTLYNSSDTEIGTTTDPLNVEGTLVVTPSVATVFTSAQVTVSATEVIVLPANAAALGATLVNTGSVNIYLGPTGVTATNSLILPPSSAYNIDSPNYTGAIYGLAASGNPVVSRVVLT